MRTLSVVVSIAIIAFGALEARASGSGLIPPASPATPTLMPTPLEQKEYGVAQETPNQRKRRLGQEITASYPPLEYGEALETPNHRRARLAQLLHNQ